MAFNTNQANVKAVITAEDRASGVLRRFGTSVEKLNDKVVTGVKRATVAFGAAASAATVFAVKSAADFEQTRIGLENMLGSADKARDLLQKISKFAADTPFEFPELAQATRQLVAFGFTGESAFKTMQNLGDVSAAVGAPINDLAYLMGTLRAQGRAFTIDIRQFAMRGIPIYEYLAKVFKTNTKELTQLIEQGKVGFPEVEKAFQMMTAEGGKFHNTMARQSKSLSGLWSTLKDVIGQTSRELVGITQEGDIKPGSLFDKLRTGTAWLIHNLPRLIDTVKNFFNRVIAQQVVPQMQQWASVIGEVATKIAAYLSPKLRALWNTLTRDLIPALAQFWQKIIAPLIPVIGTLLVGALGLLIDALNLLLKVLTPVIEFMANNRPIVIGLATAFGVLKASLMIWDFVDKIRVALATLHLVTIPKTIASLGALKTALVGFTGWGVFAAAAIGAFAAIRSAARETMDVLNRTNQAVTGATTSQTNAIQELGRLKKHGTPAQRKRATRALQGILDGRASGGFVNSGQPYIVGERGPEVMVPGRSGTVIPNHKLNGSMSNVTFNVNIGMFAGSKMERRSIAKQMFRDFQDAAAQMGINPTSLLNGVNGVKIR